MIDVAGLELDRAVGILEGLGYPFSLEKLQIRGPYRMLPVLHLRLLRNRYSSFSLAHELGLEGELVGGIGRSIGEEMI